MVKDAETEFENVISQKCLREPPLISRRGGSRVSGDEPKYFFHYGPADIYFFPAAWSANYLFHFHFLYFNYTLKAIIYFNCWQLQIIYCAIFLP